MGTAQVRSGGVALLCFFAALSSGCLTNSYHIGSGELARLAQTPPGERGQRVRVTQELVFNVHEPPESGQIVTRGTRTVITDIPIPRFQLGGQGRVLRARFGSGGGSRGGRIGGSAGRPDVRVSSSSPVRVRGPVSVGRGSGGGRASGGSGGSGGGKGIAAAIAVLAVVAVVGAGAALITTEAKRYDGWAGLHPMHTVHLFDDYGNHLAVPLAALTTEHTDWAAHAVVIEDEGPMELLERAPLNRRGLTFGLAAGYGALDATQGERTSGASLRVEVGGFPVQWLGILGTMNLAFGDFERDAVMNTRFGGELQLFPLAVGRFHAGVFGQAGWQQARLSDEAGWVREREGYYGGGVMFQVEITTRSALTLRGGLTTVGGAYFPEAHIGIAAF